MWVGKNTESLKYLYNTCVLIFVIVIIGFGQIIINNGISNYPFF